MTQTRKRASEKRPSKATKKLRLKKETLKDLSASDSRRIKGGCQGGTYNCSAVTDSGM